ncbi:MAG: hypothetical protein V1809_12990 [Planctomycetota bacterium]
MAIQKVFAHLSPLEGILPKTFSSVGRYTGTILSNNTKSKIDFLIINESGHERVVVFDNGHDKSFFILKEPHAQQLSDLLDNHQHGTRIDEGSKDLN